MSKSYRNPIKLNYFLLFVCFVLFSCQNPKRDPFYNLREAKGHYHYGGIFQYSETENFRNLYPLNTIDGISHRIIRNIYEGLIRFSSSDLSPQPSIAEKWEANEDGTIFTFHIRKGVYFHDDPCFDGGEGREVNAHDVKYCFDKLCEADANNQGFWVFKDRVKGANMYFQRSRQNELTEGGVEGVQVIDDYTIQIELVRPFAGFLNLLGTPFTYIFPKEAIEKYNAQGMRDKCVGTGPFILKAVNSNESIILIRNEKYWDEDELRNQMPYLDAIKVQFIFDKKAELLEFHKGNLDMAVPLELKDALKEHVRSYELGASQFELQTAPSLSVQFLRFLHTSEVFKTKEVRKAFNLAIDKSKIALYVLQGEGNAANNGFVPPFFKNYDASSVQGNIFNPEKARELLSKAGYHEGKGFPSIILHVTGRERDQEVASIVQKMLKDNLNIRIKIVTLPLAQLIENFETGKSLFWISRWGADYPDPENFLNLFHGAHIPTDDLQKSHLNSERYFNYEFDSLLDLANRTIDVENRFKLYQQADQLLMEDAVMIPLFYTENYRLIKPYVKNFEINGMDYRDFRTVYFERDDLAVTAED
ncbi:MAG: ABC transporter substrate-binding protein [Bacteroidia bacterium]|nr:ABC transporter substrate-binding protein [Bacteroidia bacterium]